MGKTRNEIDSLKRDWVNDPCWDLEDTEGFEDCKEELKEFQDRMEQMWREEREEEERKAYEMAEKLGVIGLYKLIKNQEETILKHSRVLELIMDGKNLEAYRVYQGYWD